MAQVWEAHDEILARAVAVKVLHPHLADDTAFLERFRREAVAAARLSHPNVVAIFDTGVDGSLAYIVMELVRGRTLRELLAARGALGPARAVQIAAQTADALDYAHGHGIVHRDVKPANVLIADDGRVKVADFGIAKAASSVFGSSADLTQTGAIVGTAKYLSPEQVNGEPQDRRADVYSLGTIGVLFARNDNVRGFLNPSKSPTPGGTSTVAKLVGAQAFDPFGGGGEHDEQAHNIIDGDPATAWNTERYASRRFGNLKPGVGIAVQLDRAEKLTQLQVTSATK